MQLRPRPSYIYCISALALLVTTWFAVGYSHPDEHFQILEFAGLKLGRNVPSNLPWEYHVQMRSAFQPAIVVWVHDFLKIFGSDNPFTLAFILRVLSAGLAFLSMLLLYKAYSKEIKNDTLAK